MLVSLHVKNLALIDEEEIFFAEGLNILTGETGAGKSVIIGSVNLALGGKADRELIRTGADYALIELLFQVDGKQREALKELDVFPEEDGTLLIQRKILENRSVCRVCGENTGVKQLREIADLLLDMHGQNEHQSLLKPARQREILDEYAKEELAGLKEELKEACAVFRRVEEQMKGLDTDEAAREREAALLAFELEEIDGACLKPGEDEELEAAYRKLSHVQKIEEALHVCCRLTGYESGEGAGENVGRALKELAGVAGYDPALSQLQDQLEDADSLLGDFNRAAADYIGSLAFDGEDFIRIESRLNFLNHLKAKYGRTIDEILAYALEKEERLKILEDFEHYRNGLNTEYIKCKEALGALCGRVSQIRRIQAKRLSESLKAALLDLNFTEVVFQIEVRPEPEHMTAGGYDQVEFMISTNKGEALRPLSHVASGGELSRIMLAFKTVLADKDEIHTLIFDEIDAGISGRTAWRVSEKLGILGRKRQVICITHLPQIAAMADCHFLIEKKTGKKAEGERTVTTIQKLSREDSLKELARMLGGASLTEAALKNAEEMKELAANTKQY